jgi:hypothetical protein
MMAGGALYVSQPQEGLIAGNLFENNRAWNRQTGAGGPGGAIYLLVHSAPRGDVTIAGNTFVGNTATDPYTGELGGAIALVPLSSRAVIANNAMAFNSSGVHQPAGMAHPTLLANAMWNGGHDYVNVPPGTGDLVADPLFVDRAAGNYRLAAASPAIDAGHGDHAPLATDLDGAPRVQDGHGSGTAVVDIGAYEYSPDLDADGTPDWSDLDDDGDGVSDADDCAPRDPGTTSPPAEVEAVLLTGDALVTVGWALQEAGTRFDVAAGGVAALREDGGFARAECRVDGHGPPPWYDDRDGPAAGDSRYYLLRAENACGSGTWGRPPHGTPRVVDACP